MITAMSALLVFWSAVLLTAAVLAVLRDVLGDDPRSHRGYTPPASHRADEFARSGSTFH